MLEISKEFISKELEIKYWGEYNHYSRLCNNNIISQSLLQACYDEPLTVEKIGVKIGVAIPYILKEIKTLCEYGLIKQTEERYKTSIIILYKNLFKQFQELLPIQKDMACEVIRFIERHTTELTKLLNINENNNLHWYASAIIAKIGVLDKFQLKADLSAPETIFGDRGFIWLEEKNPDSYFGEVNVCNILNENNDALYLLDYNIIGEKLNSHFYKNYYDDILFEVANKGDMKLKLFSKRDIKDIMNMVKLGILKYEHGNIISNIPVYSKQQYFSIQTFLTEITTDVAIYTEKIITKINDILLSVVPSNLTNHVKNISSLQMFNNAIAPLFKIMIDEKYLINENISNVFTSYIVLSK